MQSLSLSKSLLKQLTSSSFSASCTRVAATATALIAAAPPTTTAAVKTPSSSSCSFFQPIRSRSIHIERHLEESNIILPPPASPRANYNIVCHAPNNMLYVSGHLPLLPDGTLLTGAVGPESGGKTVEEGYEAARHAGLNMISTLKDQLGDLDRVAQVVKVFGIVNSTLDFKHQHLVMDGCSDVMMEVFGKPIGYHARSAIGTNTLPLDITVEVEAIVQIKPE